MLLRLWRLGFDFILSNALAIFDATECAVRSRFLSAMTEAPQLETAIAPATVPGYRWHEGFAEYGASASCSAACYEQIEHIGILPVIVPKRELRRVERKVLLRDVMEAAHDAALEQSPETFEIVGMNNTVHVLALTVTDGFMRHARLLQ